MDEMKKKLQKILEPTSRKFYKMIERRRERGRLGVSVGFLVFSADDKERRGFDQEANELFFHQERFFYIPPLQGFSTLRITMSFDNLCP